MYLTNYIVIVMQNVNMSPRFVPSSQVIVESLIEIHTFRMMALSKISLKMFHFSGYKKAMF